MSQDVFNNDVYVNGALGAKTFTPPAGSVADAGIQALAGVQASKLQHQYQPCYKQDLGAIVASVTSAMIHIVRGATGVIVTFSAALHTACLGAATVTVDLKKNGTTCLSAVISFGSGDAAYAVKSATLTVTALAQNDVLEVVVVATAGGGTIGQGLGVVPTIREDAQ